MKIFLTLLCLLIAGILFAQQNAPVKKDVRNVAVQGSSASENRSDKKVHYVDKRTKPVKSISRTKSCSQIHKKSDTGKEENKNKVLSK